MVGVEDPILGQAVEAFVVRAEGSTITEKNIIDYCKTRLESFMVPKEVEFRGGLPKTATGKTNRTALRVLPG